MDSFTSKSGRVITLRSPQEGDEKILFDYVTEIGNEDTFILVNPLETVSWQEEIDYLASTLRKIRANWQVHHLAFHNGKLVGSSQVTVQGRRKMHVGNFGISLLKDYRSDGIGFQLAQTTLNTAFEKLGIKLITLEVFATNRVAQNLYHKLGFTEYGRLPQGLKHRGEYIDSVLMYQTHS